MMKLVQFKNVTKTFQGPDGTVAGLDNVSFTLSQNELLVIRGSSGCGKTTLLLTAGGMQTPDQGSVHFIEQNIYNLTPEKRGQMRSKKIGFVFQQFHLIPYLSVRENILTPGFASHQAHLYQRCDELIEQFGLIERRHHIPAQLSVGEKQRTALARALINQPEIILADEPTGNLDDKNADQVFNYFAEFVKLGGSILLFTHDALAKRHSTRMLEMKQGRLL